MASYRIPFTADEDVKILQYIFRKNGFYRLRGLELWKELSRDELPNRTYQSLHERFRKYIITNIQNPAYGLSGEEKLKIKRIYDETGRGKKVSKAAPPPAVENRTEARNFFEMSDSDESDGGSPSRECNSSRGRIHRSTSQSILTNEEMKTTEGESSVSTEVIEIHSSSDSEEMKTTEGESSTEVIEILSSSDSEEMKTNMGESSIKNLSSIVIEIDSSTSSDSEIFNLAGLLDLNTENKET